MNTYYVVGYPLSDELYHYGTPRMHWGIRKYQNYDGTLTEAGKLRYRKYSDSQRSKAEKAKNKLEKVNAKLSDVTEIERKAKYEKARLENEITKKNERSERLQKRGDFMSSTFGLGELSYKGSQKAMKKAEKITKKLENVKWEANEAEKYRYKYENKVNHLMNKIGKYEANSTLYGDLSDKGISKNYDKIQKRLKNKERSA